MRISPARQGPLLASWIVLLAPSGCERDMPSTAPVPPAPPEVTPQQRAAHKRRLNAGEVEAKEMANELAHATQGFTLTQQFRWKKCLERTCWPAQDQCMREATAGLEAGGQEALDAEYRMLVVCSQEYHRCAGGCLSEAGPADEPEDEPDDDVADTDADETPERPPSEGAGELPEEPDPFE